jgi:hypothetical protein
LFKFFYGIAVAIINEIRQQLGEKIPNTIEKILFGRVITFTDLQDALCFKHAQNYVQQLPQESIIRDLKESVKRNKIQMQKLITDIGADKAWEYTASKLKDKTLKTELNLVFFHLIVVEFP